MKTSKMCPDLQRRIKKVYPDGTIYSMDEEELKDADRDKRIRTALDSVAKECDLRQESVACG
jgi:hypothetical protein